MFAWNNNKKLLKAAKKGDLKTVQYLIENESADMNAEQKNGDETPLYLALASKRYPVAQYLMENKKTILPALEAAIKNNNLPVLEFLVVNKCGVNYQMDKADPTPLHLAAQYGQIGMAEYLIGLGADIFASQIRQDICIGWNNGENYMATPTAVAIWYEQNDMANFLEKCCNDARKQYDDITNAAKEGVIVEEENLMLKRLNGKEDSESMWRKALVLAGTLKIETDDVKKLAIVGQLCEIIKQTPYEKSLELYEKIAPNIDKNSRNQMETIIRNQR